jgi:Protein of unknown function (DUF3307)
MFPISAITFTTNAIVAHMIGDYLLQSDWMANNKTKSFLPALYHVTTYSIPFIFLTPVSAEGFLFIIATHFAIDHWRLARYVVFAKNFMCPADDIPTWDDCKATGYPPDRPAWLSVWLLIIADNIMHIILNAIAIQYL